MVGTSLGLLVALAGGLAGVILGLRPVMRSSIDYREHQALLKQRRIGVVIVILAVAGFAISTRIPGWWAPALIYVLFFSALAWQHKVVLPRMPLASATLESVAKNPDAARQQARQRLWGWIGLIGGGLSGLGGPARRPAGLRTDCILKQWAEAIASHQLSATKKPHRSEWGSGLTRTGQRKTRSQSGRLSGLLAITSQILVQPFRVAVTEGLKERLREGVSAMQSVSGGWAAVIEIPEVALVVRPKKVA